MSKFKHVHDVQACACQLTSIQLQNRGTVYASGPATASANSETAVTSHRQQEDKCHTRRQICVLKFSHQETPHVLCHSQYKH